MTPFFQATRRSLAYQFTITAPLLCPPFSNFRKIFHFQPCFGQNFSSQDANFPNFRSLDPSFFKENPLPRPYFWKPVWHTPTKKKLSAPPPPGSRWCRAGLVHGGQQSLSTSWCNACVAEAKSKATIRLGSLTPFSYFGDFAKKIYTYWTHTCMCCISGVYSLKLPIWLLSYKRWPADQDMLDCVHCVQWWHLE